MDETRGAVELRQADQDLEDVLALLREARHKQCVQTEKLAAVGELIAGVAHEINNPLAVMLGYVNLVTHELGPTAWSVRMEVDLIVQQIERVRKIIDSLLDIARPMDDVDLLSPEDMARLIEDSLGLVIDQAQRGMLKVCLDLQATCPVRIGRQDLQQVIVNLIVNAFHAVELNGGLIEVGSRDWDGRGILISVRDTGPGVPADLVEKIFRPFFTTKGAGRGTGLGLSVSTGLIRRYGGALTLEATSEAGTEFRIWVPAEPAFDDEDTWLAQTLVSSLESRSWPASEYTATRPDTQPRSRPASAQDNAMPEHFKDQGFLPLQIAVLTVSDSRTEENDTSGRLLVERAEAAGHRVVAKRIVPDDIYRMRAAFSEWIADPEIQVILSTGGTGVTGRDSTPEAVAPLLDKPLEGFGELFRSFSLEEIGTSTLQSRALGGLANGTFIFCLPGSSGACRTAWDRILLAQLDSRTRPCNFAQLIPRLLER
ncbi:molybdenum cofactor biosynthesis protein B [Thiocapsa rosea]|uniref:Molybdenum cofactor biosynthesis protein B n=2 Tax=Thiocapsa rosea TaxID=69360 RepID=A0A495VAJ3_9GAMM|nr:molybdenum cofactor biosynthesis protein B [Thiocapsa rosea]